METVPTLEIKDNNDDDDVFYAELRRQILLLTAEDDDNADYPESKRSNPARGAKQGSGPGCSVALLPGSYFSWLEEEKENMNTVPAWLVNLWRPGNGTGVFFNLWKPGNGTGVFIPHIVKSRGRKKPRSRNNKQASGKQE